MFHDLSAGDLTLSDGARLVPGEMRQRGVAVGRHEAPAWESLPRFLARWTEVYAGVRRGDLDGRGNLAQAGLIAWVRYTLDVCIDQVSFMTQQLDVLGMRDRIRAALAYEAAVVKSGPREEALLPLHYLFATQAELSRAD
jgi:hypothetical protein